MNIFFTQTAYPPSVGGAQTHLHELGLQMAARHRIKVASFWSYNRSDWLLGTTWLSPGGSPYTISGIPVTPIQFTKREKIMMSPWVGGYYMWQSNAIRRISELLLPKLRAIAGEVDLIHHGRVGREPLGFASLALARERGIPFVLTPYHHPRWSRRLYRNYHSLYRQADAVIALTSAEVDTLVSLGVKRERVFVVGTGALLSDTYDADGFRQRHAVSEPLVLFLGQKYYYKGFAQVLQAAPLVWRERPEVKFMFIGPRTRASRLIFKRVDDPRVIELDTVSLAEKTSALAACDILCVPSKQECFGGVFVEAWRLGKPVIGAEIPATSKVVTNGVDGFIGPVEPAFLAEKILALVNDPALRDRMGAAGRRKAEQTYSWPNLASRLEAVYSQLLGAPNDYYGNPLVL